MVESKSNEIPAARTLLEKIEVDNALVLTDALHTHPETAREIVQDCGADYVMTVKGHKKRVRTTLETIWEKRKYGSFSPSA